MPRRSNSSDRWLREHFSDPYVKRAKAEGWRSRAVFKLEAIDRSSRLLKPGMSVLDLGAAPGRMEPVREPTGRGQREGGCKRSAVDGGAPGVTVVQGDCREQAVVDSIEEALASARLDVLLSDMAPNLSGMDAIDAPRSMHLAELALDLALRLLKPPGVALIKLLQGAGFQEFVAAARREFRQVRLLKPEASRSRSPETYLLASERRIV
jgi:23S rRNA (uridine2552-2'-O)-methyltransferase